MNYGGGSGNNPPWARQTGGSNSFSFNAANAYQAQQHVSQPGLAMPTSLGAAASNFNSARSASQSGGAVKQRVFTGTITKVSDNFGFVDDDVFFQTSVCKGGMPKLSDRVLVEATFNANMPFKWNATRIQLLPNAAGAAATVPQQQQSYQQAAVQQLTALQQAQLTGSSITPVLNQGMNMQMHHMSSQQSHGRGGYGSSGGLGKPHSRMDNHSSGNRTSRFDQRDRRDERRDRPRSPRRRSRSPPPRRRSRSPKAKSRSRSPRRKQRNTPRYSVTISPLSFDTESCSVLAVKSRYSNMYIPSDFFYLSMDWVKAFPLHRPFTLGNATRFNICHKDITPLQPFPESVDPSDADYSYSAKVMLLAQPSLEEIYKQCCSLTEDSKDDEFTHPTRVLQFLVGMRAKNEPLAIGGPWSPSLDGADPANNPQVLINTAIRTTKNLTGIDLSSCTQWYRFVDINYLRAEEVHKGKVIPEHTEHVVMFLPDIWSVVPAMMDYLSLQASYKRSLLIRLGHEEEPKPAPEEKPADDTAVPQATAEAMETSQSQELVSEAAPEEEEVNTSNVSGDAEEMLEKPEPTHWSKLDPKTMKVVELRNELEARSASCKGLKSQLQAKLSKLLKVEMESEEEKEEQEVAAAAEDPDKEDKPEEEKVEETPKETVAEPVELTAEEKEKKANELEKLKAHLERLYVFPEEPVIMVHPNRSAKSGKFDCSVMSLSVLLDYRPEDNKEHSFEVSLFAESFNEMLMRDFGFSIYKKICSIPDKVEEKSVADKGDDSKAKGAAEDKKDEKKTIEDKKSAEDKKPTEEKKSAEDKAEDKEDSKDEKVEGGGKRQREKSAESESKRRKKDDEEDDDKSSVSGSITGRSDKGSTTSKKKEMEKRKQVTVDKASLLAFVYYDTTHTGYIMDKDLEDMIYTLGLQASRAQVRALLQKSCTGKDNITYRKLTDKPEPQPDDPVVPADVELDIMNLAQGNKGKVDDVKESTPAEDSNVVMYKGAVLELDKVLAKMDRSEFSRLQVEKEMRSVQEERESLKEKLSRSEERVKKLTSDLKKTSDKLSTTKSERNKREGEVSSLKDVLHSSSRELHKVLKLVDGSIQPEVKDNRAAADRYTPSRESASTTADSTEINGTSAGSASKPESQSTPIKEEGAMEDSSTKVESEAKAETE